MTTPAGGRPGRPSRRLGTVAIVGVGLIGGSLALALKRSGTCAEIIGCDASPLDEAVARGVIDRPMPLEQAAATADVVVLCTPVGAFGKLAERIRRHLKPHAVVTDSGSVKGHVVSTVAPLLGSRFVGAHPIAGRERSGVAAADPDLFRDAVCILTPTPDSALDAVETTAALWESAGCNSVPMSPEVHDRVFACVSHLPHLVAFALMETVRKARTDDVDPAEYAAGGLRDFTRVAGSDPVMWRDIFLTNRDAVLAMIDAYQDDVAHLREAIARGDGDALLAAFGAARELRGRITS